MFLSKKKSEVTVWLQVIIFSALVEFGRHSIRWLSLKQLAKKHLQPLVIFLGDFTSRAVPFTLYNRGMLLFVTLLTFFICGYLFNQKKVIKELLTRNITWKAFLTGFAIGGAISVALLVLRLQAQSSYLLKAFSLQGFYALLIYLSIYSLNDYAEEIMFRGYIMERFTSVYSIHVACLLQAFIFGIGHLGGFSVLSGLPSLINAFCGGLFLGYVALYTKSFYGSFAAHLALNGFGNYLNTLANVAEKTYLLKTVRIDIRMHYLCVPTALTLAYLVHQRKAATQAHRS